MDISHVEIREPSPADAERLGRMHYASCEEAPASGSSTWIALRDGEIVGFATVGQTRPNPTVGTPARDRELWSIYVRASEYGSGLADRLLEAVLPHGAPAELWVFEANDRARRYYSKRGFAPDGARHTFGPEFGHQAEIRMVR